MQSFFQLDGKNLSRHTCFIHPSLKCKAFYEEPIVNSKKVLKYISPLLTIYDWLVLLTVSFRFHKNIDAVVILVHHIIQIYQDISTFCVSFFSQSMFWAQYSWFHTSYRPECLVDQSCEDFFLYLKTIKFFWRCIFNLLLPKCKKEVIYIQLLIIIEKNKCSVVWGGDFVVLIKFLHIWLRQVYFLFFFFNISSQT